MEKKKRRTSYWGILLFILLCVSFVGLIRATLHPMTVTLTEEYTDQTALAIIDAANAAIYRGELLGWVVMMVLVSIAGSENERKAKREDEIDHAEGASSQ